MGGGLQGRGSRGRGRARGRPPLRRGGGVPGFKGTGKSPRPQSTTSFEFSDGSSSGDESALLRSFAQRNRQPMGAEQLATSPKHLPILSPSMIPQRISTQHPELLRMFPAQLEPSGEEDEGAERGVVKLERAFNDHCSLPDLRKVKDAITLVQREARSRITILQRAAETIPHHVQARSPSSMSSSPPPLELPPHIAHQHHDRLSRVGPFQPPSALLPPPAPPHATPRLVIEAKIGSDSDESSKPKPRFKLKPPDPFSESSGNKSNRPSSNIAQPPNPAPRKKGRPSKGGKGMNPRTRVLVRKQSWSESSESDDEPVRKKQKNRQTAQPKQEDPVMAEEPAVAVDLKSPDPVPLDVFWKDANSHFAWVTDGHLQQLLPTPSEPPRVALPPLGDKFGKVFLRDGEDPSSPESRRMSAPSPLLPLPCLQTSEHLEKHCVYYRLSQALLSPSELKDAGDIDLDDIVPDAIDGLKLDDVMALCGADVMEEAMRLEVLEVALLRFSDLPQIPQQLSVKQAAVLEPICAPENDEVCLSLRQAQKELSETINDLNNLKATLRSRVLCHLPSELRRKKVERDGMELEVAVIKAMRRTYAKSKRNPSDYFHLARRRAEDFKDVPPLPSLSLNAQVNPSNPLPPSSVVNPRVVGVWESIPYNVPHSHGTRGRRVEGLSALLVDSDEDMSDA